MPKTTTQRIVGLKEDLSPMLKYTNPNVAPFFLNLVNLGNISTDLASTVISWIDYKGEATQTVLTAVVSSAEETSIEVADGSIFRVGNIILIGEEAMEIQTISENTLKVVRGVHETTKETTYAAGTEVYFINDNLVEGADLIGATYKKGENFKNFTQIFREEIDVSGTAEQMSVPSGSGLDVYAFEQMKKTDKVIGKIEKASVSGVKFENGDKRGMGGIRTFATDGQVVDANGSEISIELFNKLLTMLFHASAPLTTGNYAFYVPAKQKTKISGLLKDFVSQRREDETLGAVANRIATDFGDFPIIMTPNLPSDEILFTNHDDSRIKVMRGRNLHHEYMGKKGDSTQGLILAELTLETRNIFQQGTIKNLKK